MRERYTDSPDEGSEPAFVREVRRYPNRRLYDATTRSYVGLEAIAGWISRGEVVRVIDVKSGEDVTVPVLAPLAIETLQARLGAHPDGALEVQRWIRGEIPLLERPSTARAPLDPSDQAPSDDPLEARFARIEGRLTALENSRRGR